MGDSLEATGCSMMVCYSLQLTMQPGTGARLLMQVGWLCMHDASTLLPETVSED
jgi:hypothetical protein